MATAATARSVDRQPSPDVFLVESGSDCEVDGASSSFVLDSPTTDVLVPTSSSAPTEIGSTYQRIPPPDLDASVILLSPTESNSTTISNVAAEDSEPGIASSHPRRPKQRRRYQGLVRSRSRSPPGAARTFVTSRAANDELYARELAQQLQVEYENELMIDEAFHRELPSRFGSIPNRVASMGSHRYVGAYDPTRTTTMEPSVRFEPPRTYGVITPSYRRGVITPSTYHELVANASRPPESPLGSYEELLALDDTIKNKGISKSDLGRFTFEQVLTKGDVSKLATPNCVICLDDFKPRAKIRRLPCLCCFHVKCIDRYLKDNTKCPICRLEINKT